MIIIIVWDRCQSCSTLAIDCFHILADSPNGARSRAPGQWSRFLPRVLVLRPNSQDRPAIPARSCWHELRGRVRLELAVPRPGTGPSRSNSLSAMHALENLVSRKILNSDDEVSQRLRKWSGRRAHASDARPSISDIERRRRSAPIVELACHGNVVGEVCMRSKAVDGEPPDAQRLATLDTRAQAVDVELC
jgi:hypothetical protein